MDFLCNDFKDFILPQCNRGDFIQQWLLNNGVHSDIIQLDGKNHILVQYDSKFYNPKFKIKTVVAHYDRVQGSPGANDNSAAVWIIMNWAVELQKQQNFHNVRIFFTDGEELGWNTGVNEQGAYAIASTFRRLGITNDDVYVFDACGRGVVPILAKNIFPEKAPVDFVKKQEDLHQRTQDLLRRSCPGRWMTLPVPYSDNASFLACGIPAVAITMLPAEEASLYAREIHSSQSLESQVLNRETSHAERLENGEGNSVYKERLPLTWKLFHTEDDSLNSLTQDSCRIMSNILHNLAESISY